MYYLVKFTLFNELHHTVVEHNNLPRILAHLNAIDFRKLISIEILEGFTNETELLTLTNYIKENNLEFGGKK